LAANEGNLQAPHLCTKTMKVGGYERFVDVTPLPFPLE
jgi:hypothetical protein